MTDSITLQIVVVDQTTETDINVLDLMSDVDGFDLADNAYVPVEMKRDQVQVTENLTLQIKGLTQDAIAQSIQDFEAKIRSVYYAADVVENYIVFFRVKMLHETEPRQAYLYDLSGAPASSFVGTQFDYPTTDGEFLVERYVLTLTHGIWEELTSTDYGASGTMALGGKVNLSSLTVKSIAGDVGARVSLLTMDSPGSLSTAVEIWYGLKTDRGGVNPENLVPIWNAHKGTLNAGTTTASGADSLDGTYITRNMSASWASMAFIKIKDATGNSHNTDQRGRYQVLLRAKCVSGGAQANARIGGGFSANYASLNPVLITSTSWGLYPMGEIDLPASSGLPDSYIADAGIEIDVQLALSGSDDAFNVDALILIPALDGNIYFSDAAFLGAASHLRFAMLPSGKQIAHTIITTTGDHVLSAARNSPKDFTLKPCAKGAFVAALQFGGVSHSYDEIEFALKLIRRWRSLRGNVT